MLRKDAPVYREPKGESMNYRKCIGLLAALLVLAFFSVALVVSLQHGHVGMKILAWAFTGLSFAFGASVTYKYPVSGATAPTAQQVYGLGIMTAQVFIGDTDLTAVVTHNFGLSAQELLDLFPIVQTSATVGATVFPGFTVTKAANTVTFSKASAVGSGGTFDVIIQRPSTQQAGPLSGAR